MNTLAGLRDALLTTPLPAIGLTIAAYLAGGWLFNRLGRPVWCPGVLLAALLLAITLTLTGIDYEVYREGANWLMLLLGPATVALAVPLYQQLPRIRELWRTILICLPPAAALAAFYAMGLAWLLGASPDVLASLAPKSVTAPIAIGISEQLGGVMPLMMGALLVTGVASVAFVGLLARLFDIRDERVLGFVLGVNGHVIGTVRAFEIGTTAGAFASLGMGLTGIFSALFLPLAWQLIGL